MRDRDGYEGGQAIRGLPDPGSLGEPNSSVRPAKGRSPWRMVDGNAEPVR